MMEHWPEIASAICVAIVAILAKYSFVLKRDCERMKLQCQEGICRKIQTASASSDLKTDHLALGARDTIEILEVIRRELSDVKSELNGLNRAFNQFLSDQ